VDSIPSVKEVKIGVTMPMGNSDYISEVRDVQLGWAVSPILADEDLKPNEYSAAAYLQPLHTALALGLLTCMSLL